MAEIFLARLTGAAGFEKLVCIKRILPHLARDKQFVAMFLDEARIAARISHPNVCQVFELGEIEGSYYIAMEYLEGVPLACFRRSDYYGEMPDPRLVAALAVQACEGLHHAHQLKNTDGSVMEVVHRDISPQNLFVTADGIVKVLDFGIAKIQDATVRTSTGAVKGTYAYMAPEQLRGERVDRRTDVFALGIVMWETLMRRHLFRRETDFLTFQAITSDPIDDVSALRNDVPQALSAVIMQALSRDREQRYPTARMLGEAIAEAIQPLSGSAVSEEIARSFPAELGEQAALIRVAREGGSFDLDLERGPSLGQDSSMLTTPTSNLRAGQAESGVLIAPPGTHRSGSGSRSGAGSGAGAGVPTTQARTVASGRIPLAAATPATGSAVVAAPRMASAMSAVPVPQLERSWRPLVIAVVALAVGGAGAFVYTRVAGNSTAGGGSAVAPVVAPVATPVDAAVAPVAVAQAPAIDAGRAPTLAPTVPLNEARRTDAPAGEPHANVPSVPVKRTPPTAPPVAAKPSGPPGFITIDSAPVYATIYIDGKNYGETPLVKLSLPPGRHGVRAVAPSGAIREVHITIESGKTAPANRIEW